VLNRNEDDADDDSRMAKAETEFPVGGEEVKRPFFLAGGVVGRHEGMPPERAGGKNMRRQVAMKCSNCSQPAEIAHGNYRFKESGLNNVILCGIELVKCKHCGNEDPIIPALDDLFRTIVLALVTKPYGLAGEEVRFLRKYMGLTGDGFSRLLHIDKTTVSKWENNDDPVGTQSDLAIRMIVMSQDEALRTKAKAIIREHFEKIQFRAHCHHAKRGTKRAKYVPERPSIEIKASDLTYAYA
jgi:DNA-binding transcriptional regulator YiaG